MNLVIRLRQLNEMTARLSSQKDDKNEKAEPVTGCGYSGFTWASNQKDVVAKRVSIFCALHKNPLDHPIGISYIPVVLQRSIELRRQTISRSRATANSGQAGAVADVH